MRIHLRPRRGPGRLLPRNLGTKPRTTKHPSLDKCFKSVATSAATQRPHLMVRMFGLSSPRQKACSAPTQKRSSLPFLLGRRTAEHPYLEGRGT